MDQIKQLGYETPNIILNLGTLYVLMILYFLRVFMLLIFIFTHKFFGIGKKLRDSLMSQVIFCEFIYLFSEGYIEYLLSGVISLSIKPGSLNDKFIVHATTYIVNIICCIILPGMMIYVLLQKIETIRSENFKRIW
jgi:hypothetical protein